MIVTRIVVVLVFICIKIDHFVTGTLFRLTRCIYFCILINDKKKERWQKRCITELNPMSWSKSNSWGFCMFSKEIQIEAVSLYLKGVPTVEIRKK
ncbi:hypothetical protein AB0996_08440, partial [Weissella confusa]|uniref:hypothetical protein n=1 Tax=Weissella confusa TaxID=1583 RepID=UPI0034524075